MFQEVTLKADEPVAPLPANPLLKSHSQQIAPNQKSLKEVVLLIQIIPAIVAVSSGGPFCRKTADQDEAEEGGTWNQIVSKQEALGEGGVKVSHFSSCGCSQEQMFEKLQ